MTSDRFARLKEITLKAADLPEDEREAFLDGACGDDVEFRREVESILAHEGNSPDIMRTGEAIPIEISETTEAVDMIGRTLSHFRIEDKISAGGMGVLYRAVDLDLHRHVVIKVLKPNLLSHPGSRERFVTEARAASALNHPGIVTVHEIGSDSGIDFIAMEYVEGSSLDRMIPPSGLPLRLAVRYALAMVDALQVAHHHGIVHRDLKPANIMITPDDDLKILDFGIALRLQPTLLDGGEGQSGIRDVQEGGILGTIGYMSPEQVEGAAVDHRSDLFSFGVVLYEMIAGRAPFRRNSREATLRAIAHDDPEPLEKIRSDVPEALQEIVDRSLARERDKRYQSADDLAKDLRRFKRGREVLRSGPAGITGKEARVISLAILYIKNLGTEEDEFLSYGITEDLIIDLSRIGTLRVAPMRSVLKYKDSDASLSDITRDLNVSLVLDGSIHKSKSTVRVSAQLVDVEKDEIVWANNWEEVPDNLPKVKRDLAQGISRALGIAAMTLKSAQIGRLEAENPEAYEYYLRGKYTFERKRDSADLDVALDLFNQALSLEPALPAARIGLALIWLHRSEFDKADEQLASALSDARKMELYADEAKTLKLLADLRHMKSHWDEAWEYGEKALEIYREIGDLAGEAHALGSLINILTKQSKFSKAMELYERVIEINYRLKDPKKVALTLRNMGFMHYRMGDIDRAVGPTREALEIARKHDDISMEADCIANIGLYSENIDRDEALRCYEQALQIYTRLGKSGNRALMLSNIAGILVIQGDYRKAMELLRTAYDIYSELGERANYTFIQLNKAEIYNLTGEYDQAVEAANEALALANELDYPIIFVGAQEQLGHASLYTAKFESAEKFYREGLEIAEKTGHRREAAWLSAMLGEIHYMRDEMDLGREPLQVAIRIAKEIHDRELLFRTAAYLAASMIRDGRFEEGVNRLRKVLEETKDHGDLRFILITQRLLGQSLFEYGRNKAERAEGDAILAEALSLALEQEISHEIRWIGKILESK
jgi:serine/threonine protein kinase/Tfp pilus assembly protein PilF